MNELSLPQSDEELTKRLRELHGNRKTEQAIRKEQEKERERRRRLTSEQRKQVFDKTGGRCHLCGGDMNQRSDGELQEEEELLPHFVVMEEPKPAPHFVVDHIVPFASGGKESLDNLLPAHGLCNGCRWFYSPEEFQWILRMGIWARKQMEDVKTEIGQKMREPFLANEEEVRERRKKREIVDLRTESDKQIEGPST